MTNAQNVYVRILRAANLGVGVRLRPEECRALSSDDAIATAAYTYLQEVEGLTQEQIVRTLNPKATP